MQRIFKPSLWYSTQIQGWARCALGGAWLLVAFLSCPAAEPNSQVVVQSTQGTVFIGRSKDPAKYPAHTNDVLQAGDRLSTGEKSRAQLLWYDRSILNVDQLSLIEIPSPTPTKPKFGFKLLQGLIYFFHRDTPGELEFQTPRISAIVKGTEFAVRVSPDGTTRVSVFDGSVAMQEESGATVVVETHQEGIAAPGMPIQIRPIVEAINDLIQWFLYYPAILDRKELPWPNPIPAELSVSLEAFDAGHLAEAAFKYPSGREPASAAESIYLSALWLSVGRITEAESRLNEVQASAPSQETIASAARALKWLIQLVKGNTPKIEGTGAVEPKSATEWLVESYRRQSAHQLSAALMAARESVRVDPNFGFGWSRVAELEFSNGEISAAEVALQKASQLVPQYAPNASLDGFLKMANNQASRALDAFSRAIEMDPALGNAWLGRGLCQIRLGHREAGIRDLLTAASLEPQRSLLRSYLSKAFLDNGQTSRAEHEIQLARALDPRDPTPLLYEALLLQQRNQIPSAIETLESSKSLNANRSLYRSGLLLDQDRAVAGANLASIYSDAGMTDRSLREASHAVSLDYANYSSHLFLANSYNALRDPRQIDLRYETPWQSEYLLSQLLGPVGGGSLSPYVSEQEYSKFFERDGMGLTSKTEYASAGDWFEAASLHGQFGQTSFAVDTTYRNERGPRPNADLEETDVDVKFKAQVSKADTLFVQTSVSSRDAGDVSPLYSPSQAIAGFRVKETQEPLLLGGYHHEWSPGQHTLLLVGRLDDTLSVTNPLQSTFWVVKNAQNQVVDSGDVTLQQRYRSQLEIYTAELQQLSTVDRWTWILGTRFQTGTFDNQNGNTVIPFGFPPIFSNSFQDLTQDASSDFERVSGYGYANYNIDDRWLLTAGLSYDRIRFPSNYRFAPLSSSEETLDRLSPKVGVVWQCAPETRLRGVFTRSQGGASLDQSFQLEPSQIAGFQQSFRSLIPESVGGANAGARFETFGLGLDQKWWRATYVGITAQWLDSQVGRDVGVLDLTGPRPWPTGSVRENLDYEERSVSVSLNQLIDDLWSVGSQYQITDSILQDRFPSVLDGSRNSRTAALLHQIRCFVRFTHPSGFFAQADTIGSIQNNRGYAVPLAGEDFWQWNLEGGYRLWRRRAEIRLGVLNLTDRDYHLNPLNLTARLPHERTFVASFRFNF